MASTSGIIDAKGITESEGKKLEKREIDGELWNLDSEDLDALVERNLSPEIIHNLRKPYTKSFSLPKHLKQRVSVFLNEVSWGQTKNFNLPVSPTEVGASAQPSESIPESAVNKTDDMASEERKQLTLQLCTSEV